MHWEISGNGGIVSCNNFISHLSEFVVWLGCPLEYLRQSSGHPSPTMISVRCNYSDSQIDRSTTNPDKCEMQ